LEWPEIIEIVCPYAQTNGTQNVHLTHPYGTWLAGLAGCLVGWRAGWLAASWNKKINKFETRLLATWLAGWPAGTQR